jgi:thiol:disulfide interchange protein
LSLRIALAAVLAVIMPIVMPILALLSGGGLLVAIGFACAGHWHDAAKGLWACGSWSAVICFTASLAQTINPYIFHTPTHTDPWRAR